MKASERYEKLGDVIRGGRVVGLLACDRVLERRVVLRVASAGSPGEVQQLEMLLRRLTSFSHPTLAPVLAWGKTAAGTHYFTTPAYEDRCPLNEWLEAHFRVTLAPPTKEQILPLLACVADALDRLHEQGLAHRNLRPSSILVGESPEALITDMGGLVAVSISLGSKDPAALEDLSYAPPERVLVRESSASADIYQLGLVVYELMTGQRACLDPVDHAERVRGGGGGAGIRSG